MRFYQVDWEELMKSIVILPLIIAVVGVLYLEIQAGWITKEVLLVTLISWTTLVIGYYWGKNQEKQLTTKEEGKA
jgi:hypothetical protein